MFCITFITKTAKKEKTIQLPTKCHFVHPPVHEIVHSQELANFNTHPQSDVTSVNSLKYPLILNQFSSSLDLIVNSICHHDLMMRESKFIEVCCTTPIDQSHAVPVGIRLFGLSCHVTILVG